MTETNEEGVGGLPLSLGDTILLVVVALGSLVFAYRRFLKPAAAPRRTFIAANLGARDGAGGSATGSGGAKARAEDDAGKPRLTVLYGSQTGTAEEYSRRIQAAGRHYKFAARCVDMEDIEPEDLCDEDLVVFVIATHGEGEPTDNAVLLHEWLSSEERPAGKALKGVKFTCFGLGNRTYKHFNAMGRYFDKRASDLGGERIFRYGEGDDEGSLEEDFCAWEKDLWPTLIKAYGIDISDVGSLDDQELEYSFDIIYHEDDTPAGKAGIRAPEETGIESKTVTHLGVVTSNRELHTSKSDRSCRHVEINLEDTSLSYEAGDHIAVYPRNDTHLVDELVSVLVGGRDGEDSPVSRGDVFQLKPVRKDAKRRLPIYCSVDTALSYYVDLTCAAPVRFIKACGELATDPKEAERLRDAGSTSTEASRALYLDLVARPQRSVIEILETYRSVRMPLVKFLELAPPLHPRYYSVASSPRAHPRSAHLCAAVVEYTTPGGRATKGVATHHLKALGKGDKVIVSVRRSMFKLPDKSIVPVIMVGPGTGLAPFRGFLQERAAAVAAAAASGSESESSKSSKSKEGRMKLYFGCRRSDTDYIYREELEAYEKDGIVDLRLAFSREGKEKVYVQHLMQEDGKLLCDMILREGAAVYVCGDASAMAKDVDKALFDCLRKHGGKNEAEAKDYLQQMADHGRYAQDVW